MKAQGPDPDWDCPWIRPTKKENESVPEQNLIAILEGFCIQIREFRLNLDSIFFPFLNPDSTRIYWYPQLYEYMQICYLTFFPFLGVCKAVGKVPLFVIWQIKALVLFG